MNPEDENVTAPLEPGSDDDQIVEGSDDRELASVSYGEGARGEDREPIAPGDYRYYTEQPNPETVEQCEALAEIGAEENAAPAEDLCSREITFSDSFIEEVSAPPSALDHPDVRRVRDSHPFVIIPEPGRPEGSYTHRRTYTPEDTEDIPDDPDELAAIVASIIASDGVDPDDKLYISSLLDAWKAVLSDLGVGWGYDSARGSRDPRDVLAEQTSVCAVLSRALFDRPDTSGAEDAGEAHAQIELNLIRDRAARVCSAMAAVHAVRDTPLCNHGYQAALETIGSPPLRCVDDLARNSSLFGKHDDLDRHVRAWAETEARIRDGS